jgi:hypothetical protein
LHPFQRDKFDFHLDQQIGIEPPIGANTPSEQNARGRFPGEDIAPNALVAVFADLYHRPPTRGSMTAVSNGVAPML